MSKSFGITTETTFIPMPSDLEIIDITSDYTTFIYQGIEYDIFYTESQLDTYEVDRADVVRYLIEHFDEKILVEKD